VIRFSTVVLDRGVIPALLRQANHLHCRCGTFGLKGKISGGMVQSSGKIDVNQRSSRLNFDRGSDRHNFQATFNCRSS
jgi:hypothetical protein